MRLDGHFNVLHVAGRLENRQAISAQTFEMKRDGFLNLPSGLFDRVASRDTAVQMSVFVVRAFVRLREEVAANTAVLTRLAEIDKTLLRHDVALLDIYQKLLRLLQPPADPPKRRISFQMDER